ncbi:hypothetical protein ACHAWF_016683 [Thalassiosira exigua]
MAGASLFWYWMSLGLHSTVDSFQSSESKSFSVPVNPGRSGSGGRIVASMKTIPSRIRHIRPTIQSMLFNQTMPVDKLYLCVGAGSIGRYGKKTIQRKTSGHDVPGFIADWAGHGLLKLLFPPEDLEPVDKLLHALILESANRSGPRHNTRIIYMDDDVIYPPHLVESLYLASLHHPRSAVAFSGARLRGGFRQIRHSNERLDRHPNLYFWLGDVDRHNDLRVDVIQGFMEVPFPAGVLRAGEFLDLAAARSAQVGRLGHQRLPRTSRRRKGASHAAWGEHEQRSAIESCGVKGERALFVGHARKCDAGCCIHAGETWNLEHLCVLLYRRFRTT